MREAIEKLIAEFEKSLDFVSEEEQVAVRQGSSYLEGLYIGRGDVYTIAIQELKAVLANATNVSSAVPEHGETQAE